MKIFRNILSVAILLIFTIFIGVSTTSCNRGTGCKATENMGPKTDRRGNFKKTKAKSGLFTKKMKKKMK